MMTMRAEVTNSNLPLHYMRLIDLSDLASTTQIA